jgi:hypothetical protein
VIAHGRDAVDTAILTSYGATRLSGFTVWADEVSLEKLPEEPVGEQVVHEKP